jgi:membrane protease subunit HflC
MKLKAPPLLPVAIIAAVLFLLDASYFTIDQRAIGIVMQFGEILRIETEPGFHLRIPYVQTVKKFDARLLPAESGVQTITTKDERALQVAAMTKWRIADVAKFYRATAGQLRGTDLISKGLGRALTSELSTHTMQDAVTGDAAMLAALKQATVQETKDLGIDIVDVQLKSVELPKDNDYTAAVYDRMRAERQRVAAEARANGSEAAQKIRAEADGTAQTLLAEAYRTAEQLRGEGDAKATQIYAQAYGQDPEFFAFYRSLNAYRASFKDKQDVLVLEPKGQFFKYFKDEGSSK